MEVNIEKDIIGFYEAKIMSDLIKKLYFSFLPKPWEMKLILKYNWFTGLSIYEDIPDSLKAIRSREKMLKFIRKKMNPLYIKLCAKIMNCSEKDIIIEYNDYGFIDPTDERKVI